MNTMISKRAAEKIVWVLSLPLFELCLYRLLAVCRHLKCTYENRARGVSTRRTCTIYVHIHIYIAYIRTRVKKTAMRTAKTSQQHLYVSMCRRRSSLVEAAITKSTSVQFEYSIRSNTEYVSIFASRNGDIHVWETCIQPTAWLILCGLADAVDCNGSLACSQRAQFVLSLVPCSPLLRVFTLTW